MGIRVGIDTGGTFTDLVASTTSGPHVGGEGAVEPGEPGRGGGRGAGERGVRRRGRRVRRRRDDDRHQRRAHPARRARRLPDHAGASRTSRSSSASTASTTTTSSWRKPTPLVRRRDCIGVARAARRGGQRRSSRSTSTRSRPCCSTAPSLDGDGVAVAVCLPLHLPQPGARAARRASCCARAAAGRAGLAVARGRADLARVRARHDGDGRRVPEAAVRRATWTALDRRSTDAGRRGHVVAAEVERRARACVRGRRAPGAPAPVRHRRRRASAAPTFARAAGVDARRRARHGRDELRRLPRARRRAALLRPTSRSSSAFRSACRASPRGRSAPAAARSAGSTPAASSRSARRARAPSRAPPATARGGEEATITDANVVLGRLDPGFFLGGRLPLDPSAGGGSARPARRARSDATRRGRVGDGAGLATRTWRTRSASSPSSRASTRASMALVAFGGAGPTHACEIADAHRHRPGARPAGARASAPRSARSRPAAPRSTPSAAST